MFISSAYAQGVGGAPSSGAAFLSSIMPFLLIIPIFYFLMIRPQQRRMKAHRDMIAAVKKGDTVVTAGGLIGKVTKVNDAEVEVEVAASTKVRVVKSTLAEVRLPTSAKPANDSAA
jgi:preprotein translocase subunit YajC